MTFRFTLVAALLAAGAATSTLPACGDDDDTAAADAGADAFIPPPVGQFPAGFLWGTAIAPYQVEGNLHNTDWYQWEAGGHCGSTCSGDHADDGPDFWNKYEIDLDNAKSMSNNSIRLGIEWARVFPTAESFASMTPDAAAVQRYHDILAAARERGLEPMVTLHHFSTPVWLADLTDWENKPGWEDPAMADKFAAFAGWAAAEYGAQVDWWITLNEPFGYVATGWYGATSPPGFSGQVDMAVAVTMNMIDGHAKAYDALHAADTVDADMDGQAAMVSIAAHMRVFQPKNPADPLDVRATEVLRYIFNTAWLDAIVDGKRDENLDMDIDDPGEGIDPAWMGRADYIGLNYYGISIVVATGNEDTYPVIGIPFMNDLDNQGLELPITDYGWTIYPQGFRTVIDEAASYGVPVVITENGLADQDDDQRPRFLMDHVYEIARAIDEGVDIRGYMHWTLVDNFEWAAGYCPEFGLFHVDWDDPARPRHMGAGAAIYKRIIDANTIPLELYREFPEQPDANKACPRLGP
jgi:beta-glucosidase